MPHAPRWRGLGRHTRRRPRRAVVAAGALLLGATLGAAVATTSRAATAQRVGALSGLAATRVKANVDKTAWEYKLTLKPTKNIKSVKLIWNLPAGMHAKRVGKPKFKGSATRPYTVVKNLRAGYAKTVSFWATPKPPDLTSRCFKVTAKPTHASARTVKACLPKAPKGHSGPNVLYNPGPMCGHVDANGNCATMHGGVIKGRIVLDARNAGAYNYRYIPYQVTLAGVPADAVFSAQFSFFAAGAPITQADKTLHWVTINGQREPRWLPSHLVQGGAAEMDFTIQLNGPEPPKVCLSAMLAPRVWLPPVQTAQDCFVDPSP